MYFFYDTETSGLPDDRLPLDHEDQPYVLQLAGLIADSEGNEVQSINLLINNGDIYINPVAYLTHRISNEKCRCYGVSPQHAISIFCALSRVVSMHVGHNLSFDNKLMTTMFIRFHPKKAKPPIEKFEDTMAMAKPILKMPPTERMKAAGFNTYKNPNLSECYQYFFNKELEGAHDALVDVRASKEIYFKMKESK